MRGTARHALGTVLLAGLAALAAGCGGAEGTAEGAPPAAGAGPPQVWASFEPLAFFVERLAGDLVELHAPVPPGEDPALWLPDREEVAAMQAAPLVLVHGASFERWVELASLPLATTVVATRPIAGRLMDYREGATHSHGPAGAPAHRGVDAHTWLDPLLALEEARAVHAALARLLPEHAALLEERFAALHVELTRLADGLRALAPLLAGRTLVASHPAWEYLGAGYGWQLANVALDPAEPPDAATRERLRELAAAGAGIVLWEAEPARSARAAVAELGLSCVVYSPCETPDPAHPELDFAQRMRANLERLRAALEGR